MLLLAHFRYGMVFPHNIVSVLAFAAIGLVAFRALGLTVASVVNSVQESAILTQVLYLSMLFLSGASFPVNMFPKWLMTVTQFIPATYLVSGLQSIMLRQDSVAHNGAAVGALCLTTAVAMFVSVKLFRWEKEEKIRTSAKLWLVAVLAPFIAMGSWQAYSQENVVRTKVLARQLKRSRSFLLRNIRIFTGDGRVIEDGGLLIRKGRIEEIYDGQTPDPKALKAEVIEGAGKTVLPGLTDIHVHLGETGGVTLPPPEDEPPEKPMRRELAAYLFSGITTVRSAGDPLEISLKVRGRVGSGESLGAQLFTCGPLFAASAGQAVGLAGKASPYLGKVDAQQYFRAPKSDGEARRQVAELKRGGVDCIAAVLDSGSLDPKLLHAVASEARERGMPVIVRTGNAADVAEALTVSVRGIENGSFRDVIPDETFAAMKRSGVAYDPALSAVEGYLLFANGDLSLLNRPLLLQAAPWQLLNETRKLIGTSDMLKYRETIRGVPLSMEIAKSNLLRAWKAGVMLVAGSGAGSLLVIHGPTVQRELDLWVQAGIPNEIALQAATSNAARALGASRRFGSIRKGLDATLLLVDGNPLIDIRALSAITTVFLEGERVARAGLFEED